MLLIIWISTHLRVLDPDDILQSCPGTDHIWLWTSYKQPVICFFSSEMFLNPIYSRGTSQGSPKATDSMGNVLTHPLSLAIWSERALLRKFYSVWGSLWCINQKSIFILRSAPVNTYSSLSNNSPQNRHSHHAVIGAGPLVTDVGPPPPAGGTWINTVAISCFNDLIWSIAGPILNVFGMTTHSLSLNIPIELSLCTEVRVKNPETRS